MAFQEFTGLNETSTLGMFDVFTEMIQGYLFMGPTGSFSTSAVIQGFYSDMSLRVSDYTQNSFLKGDAIYLNPWVTPVLTN